MTCYKLVIDNYKGLLYNTNIWMSVALWGISGNARESPMPLQISLSPTCSEFYEIFVSCKVYDKPTLKLTYRQVSDISRPSLL